MKNAKSLTRRRPIALTVLLAAACLLLSACGVKLSSTLSLDDNWAGSRVITATLSQSDASNLKTSDPATIDAAINAHLPAELTYSGISASGDNYVATFTLTFTSKDDYTTKVTSLLAASGKTDPEITWDKPNTELVSGVNLKENFTDTDLLGWLPDALVTEGIIDSSNKSSVFETSAEPTVTVGGQQLTSQSTYLQVSTVQDNGVHSALVEVSLQPDDYLATTLTFRYGDTEGKDLTLLDKYLDAHKPEGAEISTDGTDRVLTFQPEDLDQFNTDIAALLGPDAKLEVKTDGLGIDISGNPSCANVCSPDYANAEMEIYPPENWDIDLYDSGEYTSNYYGKGNPLDFSEAFSVKAKINLTLAQLHATTKVSLLGKINETVSLVFPTSDITATGLDTAAAMQAIGLDKAKIQQKDDLTTATITASGSAAQVSAALDKLLPGSSLELSKPSGFFSGKYVITSNIVVPTQNISIAESTQADTTFKTPFGQKAAAYGGEKRSYGEKKSSLTIDTYAQQSEPDAQTAQFATSGFVSGLRLAGLITIGIVILIVLILIILAIIFRKKIAKLYAAANAKRKQLQQARQQAAHAKAQANAQLNAAPLPVQTSAPNRETSTAPAAAQSTLDASTAYPSSGATGQENPTQPVPGTPFNGSAPAPNLPAPNPSEENEADYL